MGLRLYTQREGEDKEYEEDAVTTILFAVAIFFLAAWLETIVWNAVVPVIFHLPIIKYWQTVLLSVLVNLFIGRWARA